eukprot:scaffold167_cov347-Prasinococcus_capsulatus_cf.AAC.17
MFQETAGAHRPAWGLKLSASSAPSPWGGLVPPWCHDYTVVVNSPVRRGQHAAASWRNAKTTGGCWRSAVVIGG